MARERQNLQHSCKLFGIKWPSLFRYLGINLGYNRQLNETKNWDEKIQDIESTRLPRLFLKPFDVDGLHVRYNFDDSVSFSRVESLPSYYKRMIKTFNKAFVTDEVEFIGKKRPHSF